METKYLLQRKQYITACVALDLKKCIGEWLNLPVTSEVICNSPSSRSMKFTLRIQSMMEFTLKWYDDV